MRMDQSAEEGRGEEYETRERTSRERRGVDGGEGEVQYEEVFEVVESWEGRRH